MTRALSVLALLAFVPMSNGQVQPKDDKDLSPSEVFARWLDAIVKKEMKTVTTLSSKSNPHRFDGAFAQFLIHYGGKQRSYTKKSAATEPLLSTAWKTVLLWVNSFPQSGTA